jgi:hypothetical protein
VVELPGIFTGSFHDLPYFLKENADRNHDVLLPNTYLHAIHDVYISVIAEVVTSAF